MYNCGKEHSFVCLRVASIYSVTDNFEEPFPDGWQQVIKNTGEIYFLDYNSGTTSWFDPRILCMYFY